MIDGFWTVTFGAASDMGAGVVTIMNGNAMGGDAAFTYIGPLSIESDGSVAGELRIKRHSQFQPSVIPGLDDYVLVVSGTVVEDSFTLTGRVNGNASHALSIVGKRQLKI